MGCNVIDRSNLVLLMTNIVQNIFNRAHVREIYVVDYQAQYFEDMLSHDVIFMNATKPKGKFHHRPFVLIFHENMYAYGVEFYVHVSDIPYIMSIISRKLRKSERIEESLFEIFDPSLFLQ